MRAHWQRIYQGWLTHGLPFVASGIFHPHWPLWGLYPIAEIPTPIQSVASRVAAANWQTPPKWIHKQEKHITRIIMKQRNHIRNFQPFSAMAGLSTIMFLSSAYGAEFDFAGVWRDFTVISYAGLSNTGPSVIAGNVALFPNPSFTGFPPGMVVNGTVYSAPNPIFQQIAQNARTDAQSIYTTIRDTNYGGTIDLTGQNLGLLNGGDALTPGVYSFGSSAGLTGTLELKTTAPGQTFIFKIGSALTVAEMSKVIITGAGAACFRRY
jgi:hypothetical protein